MKSIITTSATGRLDVMGGIADYSGSLVLQMSIRAQTTVQISSRTDGQLQIYSQEMKEYFSMDVQAIQHFPTYQSLGKFIRLIPNGEWAVYVVACYAVLWREKNIPLQGFDIQITSNVPAGKGVSSSAALEVATMRAFGTFFNVHFKNTELAILAQKAENLVVGAPCGLMDQLACCFSKPNHLLPIVCQPDLLQTPILIPENLHFVGLDSGVRHAVSGASYGEVRTAAFMGKKIMGIENDYLCAISPSVYEQKYARLLPETMKGAAFLQQFGGIDDPISGINPDVNYAIRACTQHPIYENQRVQRFQQIITEIQSQRLAEDLIYQQNQLTQLGELMAESHRSYSACGLGNDRTDALVEMVREAGGELALYGAKITGGGSGGTVCVLAYGNKGKQNARRLLEDYSLKYQEKTLAFFE